MKLIRFLSAFALLLSSESALPAAAPPDVLTPPAQRRTASDFTQPDNHGSPLALSAYRGKVVLLDFWATTCGGCKVEIPWYVEFDRKYRSQGLSVIGVSMDDEGMRVVKPFLVEHHVEYPTVISTDDIARQYGVVAMPLTLLIDRQGRIAVSHLGIVNKENFEDLIRSLLH